MAALTDAFLQPEHNTLDLSARLLTVFATMPAQQSRTLSYEEEYYQAALDYIKNNFKYSDNMRDFLLYASLTDLYNYNQTEYYIYSYFIYFDI